MREMVLLGALIITPWQAHCADPSANLIPTYGSDLLPSYSDLDPVMSGIDMLRMAVPGNPGEDYPIYAEVPDTSFTCEGRVEGGYYADTEAECQPFHVCSADRDGGLAKNSFLCPNGTLFNQENFVCEYWFNVDCSQAESFYGLNDNIGTVEQEDGLDGAASSPSGGYASPPSLPGASPVGGYAAPTSVASSPSIGNASPPLAPPASPAAGYASSSSRGYASPSSDTSLADYSSLRSGRREGRVIIGTRINSARSNSHKTNTRNSNSRFQNFPKTLRKSKTNPQVLESEKQIRKDGGNPRDLNAGRKQNELLTVTKLTTKSTNLLRRGGRRKIGSKSKKTFRSENAFKSTNLKLKNKDRKKSPNNRVDAQSTRSSKIFGKQKQSQRSGRQEVSTGYLPPIDNSYTAGDAALAASSPDYDYEEAPLPTYTGASDTAGQSSYVAPVADTGYAAGSADTSYEAPADTDDNVDALADSVYEEEPLPTYKKGSADSGTSYNAPIADSGTSYNAPIADSVYESSLPGSDYQEDILPAYNNGVYNNADSEGSSYTAPSADSYGAPADPVIEENISEVSDYEEDVLPQYNNGVYNPGSESSPTSGTSYTAPTSDDYAPPTLDNSDYEEDILPQYNNGVYNNGGSVGGSSYTAPRDNTAPATGYSPPVLGSYQDPGADILPEYFKSEITLGLNNREDVPRVEPFLSDYGAPAGDSYRVAGSSPVAAVVKTPDLTYGVPAAPTISLEDYNIQEVSDKGFTGVGGSSYGR